MLYNDALTEMYNDGLENLWRTVKATPEDKMEWAPAPDARTARALLEEIVMTTGFSTGLIVTGAMGPMDDAPADSPKKTLAQLEAEHRAASIELLKTIKEFPDARLQETVDLPWGTMTMLQIIWYPYWNLMYHWGQIAYIQTMYGDKDMH